MMQAILLAAGRGERMGALTTSLPKPLLEAGGKALIEHQLLRLGRAGVGRVVINLFHLGGLIRERLGDGSRFGLEICYSPEEILLDTGGGIVQALPLIEGDAFIVANADVWTDFDYARLAPVDGRKTLAHLVLAPNPTANPAGDFFLAAAGRLSEEAPTKIGKHTFSGISVMHRELFSGLNPEPMSVVPLLRTAMARGQVSGELYTGEWMDIGTPERLQALNRRLGRPTRSTAGK